MKKLPVLALSTLAVAMLAVGWRMSVEPARVRAPAPTAIAGLTAASPAQVALLESPQARAHRERLAFERAAREFSARAPQWGAVERSERALALSTQIDAYEARGGLSAGEAVLLRTGLVRATVDDPAQQAEAVAAIAERYRTHAARRMAAHAAQQDNDPRFQAYKARERVVIADVMQSSDIPAGMTRDQYLRQRLQQERERIYAR